MDSPGPFAALAVFLVAFATAAVMARRWNAPPAQKTFASIDGLRGYLALAVFVHHGCIWYFYARSGRWESPPVLYEWCGKFGVWMFFMITALLFSSKIHGAGAGGVDWLRLYVSRVTRLVPAYAFAVFLLLCMVAVLSGATLNQPAGELLAAIGSWLAFTLPGSPDVNGVAGTSIIVAGVMWSLPYEWFFYLCLPVLALGLKHSPPRAVLALGLASAAAFWAWQPERNALLAFAAGLAVAPLARSAMLRDFAVGRAASLFVVLLFAGSLLAFGQGQATACLFLVAAGFALIAAGNDLFGLLAAPASRLLGEMSYSVYLLHGLLLFVCFRLSVDAAALSATQHWIAVALLAPILVLLSAASFRYIERPAMRRTAALTDWVRARLGALSLAGAAAKGRG